MQTAQIYSQNNWAKQRRSEFRAGQLSQQQSICLSNTNVDADEAEKKIVNEFCHYLEKSKQLFNGLRDLPQYGHKQWQSYFGRTFDIYTKLWKFQQQNRQILDIKYGLKRWQIGEVASKIGQLYYHYYLRTSETNYLNESFAFYSAIRVRGYYSKTNKEDRPDLTVKKLRYYARFIVVCLLLKKMTLIKELVRELGKQIEEYTSTYGAEDQLEWFMVLEEIRSFVEADRIVHVLDSQSNPVTITHRLTTKSIPYLDKSFLLPSNHFSSTNPSPNPAINPSFPATNQLLSLQEILIVGNCHEQIKFSELTLDMFRILQTLEREPEEDQHNQNFDTSPAPGKTPFESNCITKRENPHKYLLYKPTISQLLTFLSSGFKELPSNGVMLLYLTANGFFGANSNDSNLKKKNLSNEEGGYGLGGVITNSRRENDHLNREKKAGNFKEIHCLYPGDLHLFTRKPFFLIVDSNNSSAFQNWPNIFGQPLVCLLSPEAVPPSFENQLRKGNLFSLFLHSPLSALCLTCNIHSINIQVWKMCQNQLDKFINDASKCFATFPDLDVSFINFFSDDFLRILILRYLFCYYVLSLHKRFRNPRFQPSIHPPLNNCEITQNSHLINILFDLFHLLSISSFFNNTPTIAE